MEAGQAQTTHYQQLTLLSTLIKVTRFVSMDQDRGRRTQASAAAASGGATPRRISRSPQQRRFVEAHLRMDTNTSHKPINTKVPGLGIQRL